MLNYVILSLTISSFIYFYQVPEMSKKEILEYSGFLVRSALYDAQIDLILIQDLNKYGKSFQLSLILQAWAFILLSFKLITTFVFSSTMKLFLLILEKVRQQYFYGFNKC